MTDDNYFGRVDDGFSPDRESHNTGFGDEIDDFGFRDKEENPTGLDDHYDIARRKPR